MSQRLFVIGNGFDRHHGIPSNFSNFGQYLNRIDSPTFDLVSEYLAVDEDFWSCFEERLATFDSDAVIDYAMNFLVPYSAEDWSDAFHHDFQYEIGRIVSGLSSTMRRHFAEWIRNLPIPLSGSMPLLRCISPDARFLSFNYTSTLQRLYAVSADNVLHIHGISGEADSDIVLGHGWDQNPSQRLARQIDEDTDTRVAEGYELIDRYFADTFKPTSRIIAENRLFFDSLISVSEVVVLGHSFAEVDAPYFLEIMERVPASCRWWISCHNEPTVERSRFIQLGGNVDTACFAPLSIF